MALKIQSLGETLHGSYIKPEIELVKKYQDSLKEHEEALGYLHEERGLTDETIAHFHLGYDSDRDAISIPIFKEHTLVNIKYRFLHPTGAKYGSEKGAETWIYNEDGLSSAAKHKKVLIVEGEFDLMSVWQSGIKNVVSPASGKNSYGPWIELMDKIEQVYIAYDNDAPGRSTAKEMAERIGTDKSFEVKYPSEIKDANEYFKTNDLESFKKLLSQARPYYTYKYKGVGDIIEGLRNQQDDTINIPFVPKVLIEKDWLIVLSGRSNVGKTTYALNLADYLANSGSPVLIMPFERGIESVGKRFLQVKFDKSIADFKEVASSDWDVMTQECVETPVYFAMPKKDDITETIVTARRLFGVKHVIIDHLDYVVRASTNSEKDIANTLQEFKRVAEENKVVMWIVTHVRKIDTAGSLLKKTPGIEDLKGSSSLYQDPECVIMLGSEEEGTIDVNIVKNKGEMTNQTFDFNIPTGKMKVSLFDSI